MYASTQACVEGVGEERGEREKGGRRERYDPASNSVEGTQTYNIYAQSWLMKEGRIEDGRSRII
jgi:hypothetical protein